MVRCVQEPGEINRNPVAMLRGDQYQDTLYLSAQDGSDLVLDASGSCDPDYGAIDVNWAYYREAGSHPGPIQITSAARLRTSGRIPVDAAGNDIYDYAESAGQRRTGAFRLSESSDHRRRLTQEPG